MGNKKIAYFSGGSDNEYNGRIISGIYDACRENDIELLVFSSLLTRQTEWHDDNVTESVIKGEGSVFDVVDYSVIDGVIILAEQFQDVTLLDRLVKRAHKNNLPVAVIDGKVQGCYNLLYNDGKGMEEVVRHVIFHHKAKRINFISGHENNRESIERLEAYKKVLAENNIPYEKERVGYGLFGGNTKVVMNDFMTCGKEFPDAIVCANDTMAVEAIGYLANIGKNVPEDVIVTGFDGTMQGQTYFPALTSCRRAIYEAGAEAVHIMTHVWNNEEVPEVTDLHSILIKNQSCGCRRTQKIGVSDYYDMQNTIVDGYKRFNYDNVNLINEIFVAGSLEQIFRGVFANAYLFDASRMYFCLNDDLFNMTSIDNENDSNFTEIMTAYYFDENGDVLKERFPFWKMMPDACAAKNINESVHFIPLYFMNKTLGYIAYRLEYYSRNSSLFYTFSRMISNAIGEFCMRHEMKEMVGKLDYLSQRDPMTALYNRRGLLKNAEQIMESEREKFEYFFGIGIDLDGLKKINDTFGHAEGDNAIIQVANAISYAIGEKYIASRTGGDEFFVFGACDDKNKPAQLIDRIENFLEKYNRPSSRKYEVECSCGAYLAPTKKVKTFESVMRFADQIMYSVKENKKSAKLQK